VNEITEYGQENAGNDCDQYDIDEGNLLAQIPDFFGYRNGECQDTGANNLFCNVRSSHVLHIREVITQTALSTLE
jgi:hypothetical protein